MSARGDDIIELINAGSFKRALQLTSKMVNQFPTMTYAKILEQYVKFRQNKKKYSFNKGLQPLLEAMSPPSDTKSLELLHDFLIELGMFEKALDVYATAMQKYPTFELGYNWFSKALQDLNFKHMSQAAFRLPRFSSEPRMLKFWHAVSVVALLKSQSEPLSKLERRVHAETAYKSVVALKPFESDQETIVFCHLCELWPDKSQEIVDELLPALLQGSTNSSVDLYLKNFLIKHLRTVDDSANMFNSCCKFLEYFDDFEVLKELIRSGQATGRTESELKLLLQSRDSRNHRLAHLEIDSVYSGRISDDSLAHYLECFHNKPCCVADILHYGGVLTAVQVRTVFDSLPAGLIHDCNRCKLGENGKWSDGLRDPLPAPSVKEYEILLAKYQSTLDSKPKTDYSACSHFVLKIVESLVQDDKLTQANALTAVSLLEGYQSKDPHNYDTRVWLIVLYCYLGAPAIAHDHYAELKIKNVQHDVLDHLLASRVATVFPDKQHPYVRQLLEGDRLYESADNLPQFIRVAFERRSYSKIFGMLELNDRLNRSSMRWLKISERLQLARVVNDKRGDQLRKLHESWRQLQMCEVTASTAATAPGTTDAAPAASVLSDNRDFDVVGGMRVTCTDVLRYIDVGNAQILDACVREMMWEMVALGERDQDVDAYLAARDAVADSDRDGDSDEPLGHVTPTDAWAWSVVRHLYERGCDDGTAIAALIEAAPPVRPTGWQLVHDYVGLLATLKTLDNTRRIKDQLARRAIKAQLRSSRDACHALFDEYIAMLEASRPNAQLLAEFGFRDCTAKVVAGVRSSFRTACNL